MSAPRLSLLLALVAAAAHAQDAPTACDVQAYVIDPDPAGLNVRAGPGREHAVVTKLSNTDLVHVSGAHGEWLRIDKAETESASEEYVTRFAGEGWVHGSRLGVGAVYDDKGTAVREQPDAAGRVSFTLAFDDTPEASLRGCRGRWLLLDYGKDRRGWVPAEHACVNTRTECS